MEIELNTIYAMNISAESAMARKIFLQIMTFFVVFASDDILRSNFHSTAHLSA